MTTHDAAFETALRVLNEGLQREACSWVKKRLIALGSHLKEILPKQIAQDLNVSSDHDMRDVIKALDILSLNAIGVLQIGYELYESDDPLAMPIDVPGEEVLHALKTGQLISPRTGLAVLDYEKHLAVVYRVRHGAV